MTTGITEVVKLAGGQELLAETLGVSQQLVSKWQRRGWVPIERVVEIEAQFGVSRQRLVKPSLVDVLG